jgi:hypothetical protein
MGTEEKLIDKTKIYELEEIRDQLNDLKGQCEDLIKEHFPRELSRCEAYDIFNFGDSKNPYDITLTKVIDSLWREHEEQEQWKE